MKYNYCLGIFLIIILLTSSISYELKKPKSKGSKRKAKKSIKRKSSKKPKSFSRKSKPQRNSLASPIDLDVLIRFKFSKFGTNVLANFVSGVLSAFYNRQFQFLQKQEESQKVVERHIKCLKKELSPLFGNDEIVKIFENKILYGGIYPFKKEENNFSVYTRQYKMLVKKNYILRIVRRLKLLTGTFQANKKFKSKKRKLNKLYKKYYRSGIPRRLLVKLKLNKKRKSKRIQKKKTIKSFKKFKRRALNKKLKKWRKQYLLDTKAKKIIGKNAHKILKHAKFMTYAFRKIWSYTSFFTKKVISCGISAAGKHRTIQKAFLALYRRNQRISCPYKYIDVLALMLEKYTVGNAFKILFTKLMVRGVKNRLIHRIKWYKIGQAVFSAHQILEKLCPWF